ncbi:MAG TPA: matrixin family metalloprotease [Gemmatimonadetes bacterium]|nr:matrixin family metalloprotease [Gemmatimonadota bacterium]
MSSPAPSSAFFRRAVCVISLAAGVVVQALGLNAAFAYEFATDTGEPDGNRLRWELGEPVHLTQHIDGSGALPAWLLHAEARKAFQTWASLPEADVQFVEDAVFAGVQCPHSLPEGSDAQEICGGLLPPHDFRSALFFIETVWPFGEEVIALTTLSWQEGGGLVDADIAFNGLDYEWTTSTEDVRVDFQSIALHEIGHFMGLAHSTEEDAVMKVDYEEGDLVREVGADDRAGLAALYPCNSPPCVGGVVVENGGCSATGLPVQRLWGVLLGALVLVLSVRSARARRAAGGAVLLGVLLLVPSSPQSSTVLALDIDALTERADRVVRARVLATDSWRDGIVWTRVTLEVSEDWLGSGPRLIELVQPGGTVRGFGTLVFGVPRFTEGEDVVVFLDESRVLGLAQGKFSVRPEGGLQRDLRQLSLARVGLHRAPAVIAAPKTLAQLRSSVVDDL